MVRSDMPWHVLAASLLLVPAAWAQKPAFCSAYPPTSIKAGEWQSAHVQYVNGKLTYPADAGKNRIADFSYAGYGYGGPALPVLTEAERVTPAAGDATSRIQAALDRVGARTPDANGFRGAVVLAPGTYDIGGSLRVNKSGVVLRGAGDGADPASNTILRAPGTSQRAIVVLGGGGSWSETSTRTNITTAFVQVGSISFDVQDGSILKAGDQVIVKHPSTQAWIDAVDKGGTNPDWRGGQFSIEFYRVIRRVEGNTVTLDAPVFNHLDKSLTQSYVAKANWTPVVQSGVEDLRINILPESGTSESHAWDGVNVNGARDCWVKRVTALHFTYAGVKVENSARVTVQESQALDPVGVRTGGRFYNFACNSRSQLILFTGCRLTDSRHGYVSNGESTVSGIVFHGGDIDGGHDMEGHRHWTQGMLWDNVVENGNGTVKLINRGDWGTSHGWGSAHSVSWRFNKASQIQKPPSAQNWGITDIGTFDTGYRWPGPTGFTEKKPGTLVPKSLYEAQVCERWDNGDFEGSIAVRPALRAARGRAGSFKAVAAQGLLRLPVEVGRAGGLASVYDLQGALVWQGAVAGEWLPLGGAAEAGVYLVDVTSK